MNHIHRLVWNAATSTWVAVAENARGRGKGSSRKLVAAALSLTLAAGLAQAAPAGGAVTSGTGTISQTGAVTTIKQATPNLSLNWSSFNIGKTETVNFVQPSNSAVAVNRILDTNASQILGRLNANGQVYLINPNGILFGQGSVVNVGGLFASSTGANAFITNNGSLIANGGGSIKLEAANVVNTGLIQAQTVGMQQGSIVLLGNMSTGTVNVGGTLDASAPNGGNGGFIETSAAHVKVADGVKVTTLAPNGQSGTWLIDPTDFTISAGAAAQTASGIGADTLTSNLGGGSVKIVTSATATGMEKGDINVNAPVSWTKNTLTLSADNNININANLNGSGTAKLALEYGQGAAAAGNTSTYTLKVLDHLPGASLNTFKAVVSLPAGLNFSTKLGKDGKKIDYTVITALGHAVDATTPLATGSAATLQSLALPVNLGGYYVLGDNIVATETKDWNVIAAMPNQGFTPIGLTGSSFTGVFDGLGHTIKDLYISQVPNPNAALIGDMAGGLVQNVGLISADVSGQSQTGSLVGYKAGGLVTNSFSTGKVSGLAAFTGGLIGQNFSGDITNSYASMTVEGAAYTGGLVGGATTGNVTNSYSTGYVHGAAGTGGLVGTITTGTVSGSYSTAEVHGGAGTGGLVGTSTGLVTLSYATTGSVTSTVAGVLTGAVGAGVGGLVGNTTGGISQSYATGNVSGGAGVGGLVGNVAPTNAATDLLINSYATGTVTGDSLVGGLSGSNTGQIINSYASGVVTGTAPATTGALSGTATVAITSNFYNSSANQTLKGVGGQATTAGVTGITTTQLATPATFTTAGWDPAIWTSLTTGSPILTKLIQNINVTAMANNVTRGYDGLTYVGGSGVNYSSADATAIAGGSFGGTILSGTISYASGTDATGNLYSGNVRNAGTYIIKPSGLVSSNPQFIVAYTNGVLTIEKAPLMLTAVASSKTYDGSTYSSGAVVSNKLGNDTVTGATQSYGSKNVMGSNLSALTVNTTGYVVNDGNGGANYSTPTYDNTAKGTITAKAVTLTAPSLTKTYDAGLTYTLLQSDLPALSNQLGVAGDSVSNISLAYLDKNVGTVKTVNASAAFINDGNNGANYNVTYAGSTSSVITKANLMVTGLTAATKTYDTTTLELLSGTASVTRLGTDDITLDGTAVGNFATKIAGSNRAVTVTGNTLRGADAGNYNLLQQAGLTANVDKANLVITGLLAADKVYDATKTATVSGTAVVSALAGDTVTIDSQAAGTAAFENKNAGLSKKVIVSGFVLGGTDAGNYNNTGALEKTATISQANLVQAGLTAAGKVYDAATNVTLSGAATVSGLLLSDQVTLDGTAVGTLASKNAGSQDVTISGNQLTGYDAGNYKLVQQVGLTAVVSKADLKVTGLTAATQTYTASTVATLGGTAVVNKLGSDVIQLDGTAVGTFANKNIGANKAITVSGNTLSGLDAGNYNLLQQTGLSATLDKANLVVTGVTAASKTYDATTAVTLTGSAVASVFSGDVVTINGTGVAAFKDKNVGTAKEINATGYTLSGTDSGNYNTTGTLTATADVNKASLTVSGLTASAKTYDATTVETLGGHAKVTALGSDVVSLGGAAVGAFADKNVDLAKAVTTSGVTLSGTGADNGNYTLVQQVGLVADINKADLRVTGLTAASQTYTASTVATLGGTAVVSKLGSDVIQLDGTAVGAFTDKNVGNGKAITVSGNTLSGVDAGNYNLLQQTGLTATLTKANLVVTGITVADKVYDGNVSATVSGGTAIVNALGSDQITITGTTVVTFANKNVEATDKVVLANGYTVSGTDAGNYNSVGTVSFGSSPAPKITRLSSVTWTGGGATPNWFDPLNWANGAIPDLANVASVVIPAGVTVSFNNTSLAALADGGTVNVDTVGSTGNLTMVAGTLNVANSLALAGFTQTGGTLGGTGNVVVDTFNQSGGKVESTGNFNVTQSFTQPAPGVVAVGGNISINQAVGDLSFNSLSGKNIVLTANNGAATMGTLTATGSLDVTALNSITQTPTSVVTVGGISKLTSTSPTGDIILTNAANDFVGPVIASARNISITDINDLTVALNATGNSALVAGGNLAVSGNTNDLTTTTTNGGTTTYGADPLVVRGKLLTNSSGLVSKTGLLTVEGTTSIYQNGIDVTDSLMNAGSGNSRIDLLDAKALSMISALQTNQKSAVKTLSFTGDAPLKIIEEGMRLPDNIYVSQQ